MGKRDFQGYICRPFCLFYREGEQEELACQGAKAVERLVARGVLDPSTVPGQGEKKRSLWGKDDPSLTDAVCGRCPFAAEDCDFRRVSPPADAEPCGGYILLRLLLERGGLSAADLAEVADG